MPRKIKIKHNNITILGCVKITKHDVCGSNISMQNPFRQKMAISHNLGHVSTYCDCLGPLIEQRSGLCLLKIASLDKFHDNCGRKFKRFVKPCHTWYARAVKNIH